MEKSNSGIAQITCSTRAFMRFLLWGMVILLIVSTQVGKANQRQLNSINRTGDMLSNVQQLNAGQGQGGKRL